MKTQQDLIVIWNELPSQEKIAFGDRYISHESNLRAWDKNFSELSPLKQKRVLQSIENFSKIPFHDIIGSGIYTSTLEVNCFKNGVRVSNNTPTNFEYSVLCKQPLKNNIKY